MRFRFLAMSLCVMVSLSLMVGCSAGLVDSDKLVSIVEKNIPNSSLVEVSNKKGLAFEERNVYQFTNGAFDFSLENYMSAENALGMRSNVLSSDYLDKLILYRYTDIVNLASGCNIDLIYDKIDNTETTTAAIYKKMVDNPENAYIKMIVNGTNVDLSIYLNDSSQIDSVYGFIYGFYGLLQDYLPSLKDNDFHFILSFCFHTKETMLRTTTYQPKPIMKDKAILLSRDLEIGLDERCLLDCYTNNARVNSAEIVYDGEFIGCPEYIDRLFINGKEVELEDYSFLYNAEDGRYYAKVYCGVEPTNSGNLVGEKVQKAILEMLYPECNYEIASGKFSSYTINGELYKISRVNGGFIFIKGGRDLKIENFDKLGENLFNREDYQLVYINDFAEILGL